MLLTFNTTTQSPLVQVPIVKPWSKSKLLSQQTPKSNKSSQKRKKEGFGPWADTKIIFPTNTGCLKECFSHTGPIRSGWSYTARSSTCRASTWLTTSSSSSITPRSGVAPWGRKTRRQRSGPASTHQVPSGSWGRCQTLTNSLKLTAVISAPEWTLRKNVQSGDLSDRKYIIYLQYTFPIKVLNHLYLIFFILFICTIFGSDTETTSILEIAYPTTTVRKTNKFHFYNYITIRNTKAFLLQTRSKIY